jgi:hypothetical protein
MASAKCVINPNTIVKSCPTVENTPCAKSICQKQTGKCESTPINEGGTCDDGNAFTAADKCIFGKCTSGKFLGDCQADKDCASKSSKELCAGFHR